MQQYGRAKADLLDRLVGAGNERLRQLQPKRLRRGWNESRRSEMEIADGVKRVIAKELKISVEQLRDETRFADLGAESIDIIEIVFALEEKYDIDISVNFNQASPDAGKSQRQMNRNDLATIGDICAAVQSLLASKASR